MLLLGALCSRSSLGSAGSIRAKMPLVPAAGVDIEIPQSNYPLELPFALLTPSHLQVLAEPTAFDALSVCRPLCPASQKDHPSSISENNNIPYLLQITLPGVTKPSIAGDSERKDTKIPSNAKIPSLPPFRKIYLNYNFLEPISSS